MYRIMIVEDEPKIADMLAAHLRKYGYEPLIAQCFHDLKNEFLQLRPHLVLLDINLPYYDGFYWCRQIRTVSNVPIIYVSARAGEMDQVMAIENGGDDYLTKPFHLDVVLAKMKSLLRRVYGEYAPQTAPADVLDVSGLMIDRGRFEASYGGRHVSLSKTELQLLDALAQAAGRVVRRETLLETIWDDTKFVDDNTLTVNITRLRKKMEELGLAGCIETVRGTGYKLTVNWESGGGIGRGRPGDERGPVSGSDKPDGWSGNGQVFEGDGYDAGGNRRGRFSGSDTPGGGSGGDGSVAGIGGDDAGSGGVGRQDARKGGLHP